VPQIHQKRIIYAAPTEPVWIVQVFSLNQPIAVAPLLFAALLLFSIAFHDRLRLHFPAPISFSVIYSYVFIYIYVGVSLPTIREIPSTQYRNRTSNSVCRSRVLWVLPRIQLSLYIHINRKIRFSTESDDACQSVT